MKPALQVILEALDANDGKCLDNVKERSEVGVSILQALIAHDLI